MFTTDEAGYRTYCKEVEAELTSRFKFIRRKRGESEEEDD